MRLHTLLGRAGRAPLLPTARAASMGLCCGCVVGVLCPTDPAGVLQEARFEVASLRVASFGVASLGVASLGVATLGVAL